MKRTYHQGNRANSLITKETENLYLYCFGGIREVSLYRILKDSCELKPSNYEKNLLEILVMKKKIITQGVILAIGWRMNCI